MQLQPGKGIDNIKFGQTEQEIVKLLGKPDKSFVDEDDEDELIYQYNSLRLQVTFYRNEDSRLGYIRCANPAIEYRGKKLIGVPVEDVVEKVFSPDDDWDVEQYQFFDTYVCTAKWVVLNASYEAVTDIEVGVPFDDDTDTYDWPQ
jgi:hypothetical protein